MTAPSAPSGFAEQYEQALVGPLFLPWADPLLDDARLAAGDRVLDVACGTGIVARRARRRLGDAAKVVGIDSNPAMLAVARQIEPGIDWRAGDACAPPLGDDERFDVVVCQQGLQFFPDRPAAARRMRSALAPGGRLAVSTWRPDEEVPVLVELRRLVERHVGAIVDRRHALGEAGVVESLLRDAGLRGVRSKTVSRTIGFADGAVFARLNALALLGMSAAAGRMSAEQRATILADIESDSADTVRRHTDEAGFRFELGANVVTAER